MPPSTSRCVTPRSEASRRSASANVNAAIPRRAWQSSTPIPLPLQERPRGVESHDLSRRTSGPLLRETSRLWATLLTCCRKQCAEDCGPAAVRRQRRVVRHHRLAPDRNRIGLRAQPVAVETRAFTCNPFRLAGDRRAATIERRRRFQRHIGTLLCHGGDESAVQFARCSASRRPV